MTPQKKSQSDKQKHTLPALLYRACATSRPEHALDEREAFVSHDELAVKTEELCDLFQPSFEEKFGVYEAPCTLYLDRLRLPKGGGFMVD